MLAICLLCILIKAYYEVRRKDERDLQIPPKCQITYERCPSLVSIEGQMSLGCDSRFGVYILAFIPDLSHHKDVLICFNSVFISTF